MLPTISSIVLVVLSSSTLCDSLLANQLLQNEGIKCFKECFGGLYSFVQSADTDYISLFENTFTKQTELDKFCSHINNMLHCTNECEEFALKEILSNTLSPVRFICDDLYDEFKAAGPCLAKWIEGADQGVDCVSECGQGGLKYLSHLIHKSILYIQTSNLEGMAQVMDELCEYQQCLQSCWRPDFKAPCGDYRCPDLFWKWTTMSTLAALKILEGSDMEGMLPHCKQVAAGIRGFQNNQI